MGRSSSNLELMKQKRSDMSDKFKTAKEYFRQESLDAWKEFQRTGNSVPNEQVMDCVVVQ